MGYCAVAACACIGPHRAPGAEGCGGTPHWQGAQLCTELVVAATADEVRWLAAATMSRGVCPALGAPLCAAYAVGLKTSLTLDYGLRLTGFLP